VHIKPDEMNSYKITISNSFISYGKSYTIADLLSRRKDFEGEVNPNTSITLLPEHLFACKVYLEDNPETCQKILQKIHDTPVVGHPGISNIWTLINCKYEGP